MPTEAEIQAERERLYESAVLREELNDDEATILLEWGEKHIVRLAGEVTDNAALEQQARFLRQLLKNMNRFVGQRQYNNRDEQLEYLAKVIQWLGKLGFKEYSGDDLLDQLPSDAKDMNATLRALITAIDPGSNSSGPASDKPAHGNPSALKDQMSAQNTELSGSSMQTPRPHHDANSHDDLGLNGPSHASSDGSLRDSLLDSARDQMKKASMEASLREHMDKAQSGAKENDALNALRKSLGLSSESSSEGRHLTKPSSEEDDSPYKSSSKPGHDQLINPPHLRDKDKDDGKD